jgi:hypothetical protein
VSLLSDAVAGAFTILQGVGGESIIYAVRCDGYVNVEIPLTAVPGLSTFEQDGEMGVERWEAKDFLIRSIDLVHRRITAHHTEDPEPYEPRNGDDIRWNGHVYRVSITGNAPCFDYMDSTQQLMRVHTKLIGKEEQLYH